MKINDNIPGKNWSVAALIGDRFGRYAKYIIQDRALPDVRDGLKPVQRRILYAMWGLKLIPTANFRKAARVVGEVIGKYHPHGDNSVYEALIKLSQGWRRRYPLVVVQGNNGSIDGDPAAAMRYTEVKLAPIAHDCLLQNVTATTVKFKPNFDESDAEPVVLAASLPFVLLNGISGIAAGYATNIPPHNLGELVQALVLLTRRPTTPLSRLLTVMPGPDFPTGGIINQTNLTTIYQTGRGRLTIRAKITVHPTALVISEIPYEQTKAQLYAKLQRVTSQHQHLNVRQVVDESDRHGLKITLYLQAAAQPAPLIAFLYKHTPLEVNYQVNMVAIVGGHPRVLGLKAYLTHFMRFHAATLRTQKQHRLEVINHRLHLLWGINRVLQQLDLAVSLIRQAPHRSAAQAVLQHRLGLSAVQAEAVVKLRLYQLTATDTAGIQQQIAQLRAEQTTTETLLHNQAQFQAYQVQLWQQRAQQFADPRRTTVVSQFPAPPPATNRPPVPGRGRLLQLVVSRDGYIGGCWVKSTTTTPHWKVKDHDVVVLCATGNQAGFICLVTNYGQAARVALNKINITQQAQPQQHVSQMLHLAANSKIIQAWWVTAKSNPAEQRWLIGLNNGHAKVVGGADFNLSARVKSIIKLAAASEVICCQPLTVTHTTVLIGTHCNRWLVVRCPQIPHQKLTGGGVKLITLAPHDQVRLLTALDPLDKKVVMIGDNQLVKTVALSTIKTHHRGAKGQAIAIASQQQERLKTGFVSADTQLRLAFCYQQQLQIITLDLKLKSRKQLINRLALVRVVPPVRLFRWHQPEAPTQLQLQSANDGG